MNITAQLHLCMENNCLQIKADLIKWVKSWYDTYAPYDTTKIVVGVSGGVISNVMLCLLCTALGPNKVIGVLMRDQTDIKSDVPGLNICDYVKVNHVSLAIYPSINALKNVMTLDGKVRISEKAINNLPARMRMVTLYAYAQSIDAFVVSTQTLSDSFVGHNTIYGDGCGDFAPFANLTREEIINIGRDLGMDEKYLSIEADDMLPASTPDEHKFGFTYEELDTYIRTGIIENTRSKSLIDRAHAMSRYKRDGMASFNPKLYVYEP